MSTQRDKSVSKPSLTLVSISLGAIIMSGALYYALSTEPAPESPPGEDAIPRRASRHTDASRDQIKRPITDQPSLSPSSAPTLSASSSSSVINPIKETGKPGEIHKTSGIGSAGEVREPTEDETRDDVQDDELVFSTDREGIKAAFSEINAQVKECYSAWLQENPSIEGRVVVSLSITPPQAVDPEASPDVTPRAEPSTLSQVEEVQLIVDEVAHPMMSGCILNSVEGMRFEAVDKPITVNYPYRFAARSSAEVSP